MTAERVGVRDVRGNGNPDERQICAQTVAFALPRRATCRPIRSRTSPCAGSCSTPHR